jgi:hypothetical protein
VPSARSSLSRRSAIRERAAELGKLFLLHKTNLSLTSGATQVVTAIDITAA